MPISSSPPVPRDLFSDIPVFLVHPYSSIYLIPQRRHGRNRNMTGLGGNNLINNTIILSLIGSHEKVPISILRNLILSLSGIFRHVLVQTSLDEQNLLSLNLNIGSLTLRTTQRLMNHNPRIRKRLSLPGRTSSEEKGTHRSGHTEADGLNVAGDEFHGVVDGEAGGDGSTGGVDVEGDVLVGIFVGEVEELGDENVGDFVVDVGSEEEDAVFEEARDYVDLAGSAINGWEGWWCAGTFGLFSRFFIGLVHIRSIVQRSLNSGSSSNLPHGEGSWLHPRGSQI
mmetsp:Transcript_11770/g.17156  ORF Transcript_11770/g.17156 Transcript_11770/m.17156 type:complete len:283 (+) Transcript_11770:105-953(+)